MKLTINPPASTIYATSEDGNWVVRRSRRNVEKHTRSYHVQQFVAGDMKENLTIEASSIITFCEALLQRYPEDIEYIHLVEHDGDMKHTRVVSRQRELNLGVAA